MVDTNPSKKEIVGLVEAQAKSIDSISERLLKIENLVDKQDSRNRDIIIAVLVAFVLVVGSAVLEVVISNQKDSEFYSGIEKKIYEQNLEIRGLSNGMENLQVRNPYLK